MNATKKKTSGRPQQRQLRFARLCDLVADIEQFKGAVRTTGKWTPAQNVTHVALLIKFSLDGFEAPNAPLLIRGVAKMMRWSILNKPMRSGMKLPKKFNSLKPPESITWDEALAGLKKTIDRIDSGGKRMTHRSPLLGFLEHEEWIQLHCRHAEMHFSFLKVAKDDGE